MLDSGLYILTYCLHEYSHELSCCHSMCFQFYHLPSCNSFTQQLCFIILGEIPLVKPWPPVHSFTLITTLFTCFSPSLACWSVFTFIAFNHIFHTIRLIFCFQQEGKINNLPGSLRETHCCTTSHLPLGVPNGCIYSDKHTSFVQLSLFRGKVRFFMTNRVVD